MFRRVAFVVLILIGVALVATIAAAVFAVFFWSAG